MNKDLVIPKHIGIIVDGNGRWAQERGLSRSDGHKAGFDRLKEICLYAQEVGVSYLSLYVFSTENFKRDKKEVDYLMKLFVLLYKSEFKDLMKKNIKVVFSGRREPLPKDVLTSMDKIVEESKNNTGMVVNFCLNYGAKTEILDMTKRICLDVLDGKLKIEDITFDTLDEHLYQNLPPLDFVIRTSGELRLSNFLPWQSVYAELLFIQKNWPDFEEEDLDKAIIEYQKRTRKFGAN